MSKIKKCSKKKTNGNAPNQITWDEEPKITEEQNVLYVQLIGFNMPSSIGYYQNDKGKPIGDVLAHLCKLLESGFKFTKIAELERILKYILCTHQQSHYGVSPALNVNNLFTLTRYMYNDYYDFLSVEIWSYLLNIYNNENGRDFFFSDPSKKLDIKAYRIALYNFNTNYSKRTCYITHGKLLPLVHALNIKLDSYEAKSLVNQYPSKMFRVMINYIENNKCDVEDWVVERAIKNGNIKDLKDVLVLGGSLTTKSLEEACIKADKAIIEFIIDNTISANEKCMTNYVNNCPAPYVSNYGRRTKKKTSIKKTRTTIDEIIDLLIENGSKLTFDHVLILTSRHIALADIDKYDLKFDTEKYSAKCAEVSFYPYPDKFKANIGALVKECCKSGNLTVIRDMVKTNNITPNEECVEEASRIKSNLQTLRFLVEQQKAPVTFTALKNMCNTLYNRGLAFLLEEFDKVYKAEKKELLELREKVKKLEGSESDNNEDSDNDEPNNIKSIDSNSNKKSKKTKKIVKIVKKRTIESDVDSDIDTDSVMSEDNEPTLFIDNEEDDSDSDSDNDVITDLKENDSDSIVSDNEIITDLKSLSKAIDTDSVMSNKSYNSTTSIESVKSIIDKINNDEEESRDELSKIMKKIDQMENDIKTSKKSINNNDEESQESVESKELDENSTESNESDNDSDLVSDSDSDDSGSESDDSIVRRVKARRNKGKVVKKSYTPKKVVKKIKKSNNSSNKSSKTDDTISNADYELMDVSDLDDISLESIKEHKYNEIKSVSPDYDYMAEKKISKELKKELKLKKTELNFIELRRALFTYFASNKSIVNNKIKLSSSMKSRLNVKESEVSVDKLDGVVQILLQ